MIIIPIKATKTLTQSNIDNLSLRNTRANKAVKIGHVHIRTEAFDIGMYYKPIKNSILQRPAPMHLNMNTFLIPSGMGNKSCFKTYIVIICIIPNKKHTIYDYSKACRGFPSSRVLVLSLF